MPERLSSLPQLIQDPLLSLLLLACVLLAASAILGGFAHRTAGAAAHPPAQSALLGSLALALGLHLAGLKLQEAGVAYPRTLLLALEHFLLLAVTLAYGPFIGLLAGLAYLLLSGQPFFVADRQAQLVLQGVFLFQLLLTGWLAIYPSPRRSRWAGVFSVVAGYLLATATLALLPVYLGTGKLTFLDLIRSVRSRFPELLIWVLLALLLSPAAYGRLYPLREREAQHSAPTPPQHSGAEDQTVPGEQ